MEEIQGGWHIKDRDDGKYCIDVMRMLFNYRVVLGDPGHRRGYLHGWCYFGHGCTADGYERSMPTAMLSAVAAANAWDGYGDGPPGYDKQAF